MAVEQLWWTRTATGLSGRRGFQVRAASAGLTDAQGALFQSVYSQLAYTIASDIPLGAIDVADYPVCLAFVLSDGIRSLVHKKYVGDDGADRQGNYFVHAIVDLPAIVTARHAVSLWRSAFWSERDTLEPDVLELPVMDAVAIVEDAEAAATGWELSKDDVDTAATVIHLVMRGMLHDDGRLYIVAPPDVVAAVVRAAAEALPQQLLSDLTFSTFEDEVPSTTAKLVGTCWQAEGQPAADDPSGRGLPVECRTAPNRVLNWFTGVAFDPEGDEFAAYAAWAVNHLASVPAEERASVRDVRRRVEEVSADPAAMLGQLVLLHRLSPENITRRDVELALDPASVELWWDLRMNGVLVREAIVAAAVELAPELDASAIVHPGFRDLVASEVADAAAALIQSDLEGAKALLNGLGRSDMARLRFEAAVRPRRDALSPEQRTLVRKAVLRYLREPDALVPWLETTSAPELRELLLSLQAPPDRITAFRMFAESEAGGLVASSTRWDLTLEFHDLVQDVFPDGSTERDRWLRFESVDDALGVLGLPRARSALVDEGLRAYFEGLTTMPEAEKRWDLTRRFADRVDAALTAASSEDQEVATRWLETHDADFVERLCIDGRLPRSLREAIARAFICNCAGDERLPFERRWSLTIAGRDAFLRAVDGVIPELRRRWLAVGEWHQLESVLDSRDAERALRVEATKAFLVGGAGEDVPADERWSLTLEYPDVFERVMASPDLPGPVGRRWLATVDYEELGLRIDDPAMTHVLRVETVRSFIDNPSAVLPDGDPWELALDHPDAFREALDGITDTSRAEQLLSLPCDPQRRTEVIEFLWSCGDSRACSKAFDRHAKKLDREGIASLVEARAGTAWREGAWLDRRGGTRIANRYVDDMSAQRLTSEVTRKALTHLATDHHLDERRRERATGLLRDWWFAAANDGSAPVEHLAAAVRTCFPGDEAHRPDLAKALRSLVIQAVSTETGSYARSISLVAEHLGETPDEVLIALVDGCLANRAFAPIVALARNSDVVPLSAPVVASIEAACRVDPDLRDAVGAVARRSRRGRQRPPLEAVTRGHPDFIEPDLVNRTEERSEKGTKRKRLPWRK